MRFTYDTELTLRAACVLINSDRLDGETLPDQASLDAYLELFEPSQLTWPDTAAEVAGQLRQHKALQLSKSPLAELWRHPLHTREMGSQLTNVLRCLYLESQGYKVTVTELVGWEHSMKNELILAEYTGQRKHSAAMRLQALLEEFGLKDIQALRYPLLSLETEQ
jgi:hypothetical protein